MTMSNITQKDLCTRVMTKKIQTMMDHGIFDSGTTGHFLLSNAPMIHKQTTTNPLQITIPDGCIITSMIPVTAQKAHIVPDLAHLSPIFVKQFCDAGFRVEYDSTNCYV